MSHPYGLTEGVQPQGDLLGIAAGARWIRRNWRLLVSAAVGGAVLSLMIALLVPSRYASATTILPEARSMSRLGGLSGLAGQLGIALPTDGGQSPQFYAEAALSRSVLVSLLQRRFTIEGGRTDTLLNLLNVSNHNPRARLDDGVKLLSKRIETTVHSKSGTLIIEFESPSPLLSKSVLDSLLGELNSLNLTTRRSQATEKRRFLADRRDAAQHDLQTAEGTLKTFYEQNRVWEGSPQLRMQEQQLRRQIDAAEQLYSELVKEFETARIEEFDQVPVFSVIDPPYVTTKRSFPKRLTWALFGFAVSLFAAATFILVRDYLRVEAVRDAEEFSRESPPYTPRRPRAEALSSH